MIILDGFGGAYKNLDYRGDSSCIPTKGVDDVNAPDGIDVPWRDRHNPYWETVMSEIATIGLDPAKNVFPLHGADQSGKAHSAQVAAARSGSGLSLNAHALCCRDAGLWRRAFPGA